MSYTRDKKIALIVYFAFYYSVFTFFYFDDRLLSQFQPVFFTYNRDLTELILIATGLPRWMMAHPRTFATADVLAFLLPAVLLVYALRNGRFSRALGIAFLVFLGVYLLLADLFWQVHHEPFILYLLLAFAWITNREERFYQVLRFCRYYFLYIFASAAVWKIARGAIFNGREMSRILLLHHTDLLTGHRSSAAGQFYFFLIDHPALSYLFYLGGTMLEGCFIAGFFTRRRDRTLIVLAIVFVVADLLLMRIPYWTILLGTVTLWIGPRATPRHSPKNPASTQKKIIIYETTHHENLPALLDLSEACFSEVAVFLKALSYSNLSGTGSPEHRWPHTDFFVQPSSCSNRRFIGQLFAFLRRHRYSHLHLSTLDNNLLLFALRLALAGPVHISLTVHEVNEYFSLSFHGLRDWSENIAKLYLRHSIRHYSFFLPAMADRFRQQLPNAKTVFIPSRFYAGISPIPASPAANAGLSPAATSTSTPSATSASIPTFSATPFIIVIPGSVDPNRRNYAAVAQALTLFFNRNNPPAGSPVRAGTPRLVNPSPLIELVILGDSRTEAGAAIVAGLQSLADERLRLRHFKGYIPETVYERELAAAHLIWSPLNLHKISSRNSPETYGLTTASGLTADLLLHNIPALVPAGFIVPEPFRKAIFDYQSPENALQVIERMIGDPSGYLALRQKIHLSFGWFSKENFREAFASLMDE